MRADVGAGPVAGLEAEHPYDGITRRTIHGSHHTLVLYEFAPGAEFPMHRHDEEQTTLVQSGEVQFVSANGTVRLVEGDWALVRGGVPHRILAGPAGARFIAVVAPARRGYEVLGAEAR
jgi:quercetin dioxygenase-like cupin family protein